MKVLQVLTHLNLGGIPTYVYNISKYLVRNEIEVAVASSPGPWEAEFNKLGIKTYCLDIKTKNELSPNIITSFFELKQIEKDFKFDILHSHTRVTQILCSLYAKIYKTPHIANFHGFYEKNKVRLGRKLIKAQGDISIAITPATGMELIDCFGADPKKVRVILSSIDFERLNSGIRPMKLDGNPKIGASGRLSPVKGFNHLIAAMPIVLNDFPDARLYIAGDGSEEKRLKALADELKIADKVTIFKAPNIADFLKPLDIFCLPSLQEPLGLSVIEAQYFGIPSIVSDAGGLTLLVEDQKTGLVVEKANPAAVAQAIKKLMLDPELKNNIAIAAQKQAYNKFDLSKKIHDFIAVYNEVLN